MRIRSLGDPEAPAVVLIHGLSSSPHSWQRNLGALGAGRRLLIVELFPIGARPRFRIHEESAQLQALLACEPEPVTVIGHSLGGLIALHAAAEAPAVVQRLVLVSTPAHGSSRSVSSQLLSVATSGARTDLRSVAVVASTLLTANPLQLAAATHATLKADLAASAADLVMPCLLVWGTEDTIVPMDVGRQLAASIRDARLVLIEGAGHQPQWEAPDAFHLAVLPFLESA